ncbi:MAG TPA: deoxyribonuclease IV [Verrucomicrobiota bacterium]|nr:deoxyribonuclease IV [Verrucomicrobiota bacterium]
MIFGAHCSTAGGVHMALKRAEAIGASLCQIFVKNNMQWSARLYSNEDLDLYRSELSRHDFQVVFGHTGYLINLAAPASVNREKSLESLMLEIELAGQLGLPFLVLHPGAHLGKGDSAGLDEVVSGLNQVLRATRESSVRIALENTAGQGTCLGHQIAHLAEIFSRVDAPQRLGVCLDTAHCFAAGYDLRQPRIWNGLIDEVDRSIGIEQVLAFHLNDSKARLGSRVDRHASIGEGEIGKDAFRHIVNDPRFLKHPGCLETPKSPDLHEDRKNLAVLQSLLERKRPYLRIRKTSEGSKGYRPKSSP